MDVRITAIVRATDNRVIMQQSTNIQRIWMIRLECVSVIIRFIPSHLIVSQIPTNIHGRLSVWWLLVVQLCWLLLCVCHWQVFLRIVNEMQLRMIWSKIQSIDQSINRRRELTLTESAIKTRNAFLTSINNLFNDLIFKKRKEKEERTIVGQTAIDVLDLKIMCRECLDCHSPELENQSDR